jgi:hypothetical protein
VTLYELSQPVVFQRPAQWQAHLRYACRCPTAWFCCLLADTWLLALTEALTKSVIIIATARRGRRRPD